MGLPNGSQVRTLFVAADGTATIDQNGVHIEISGLKDIGGDKYFLLLSPDYVPDPGESHKQ